MSYLSAIWAHFRQNTILQCHLLLPLDVLGEKIEFFRGKDSSYTFHFAFGDLDSAQGGAIIFTLNKNRTKISTVSWERLGKAKKTTVPAFKR